VPIYVTTFPTQAADGVERGRLRCYDVSRVSQL